MFEEFYEMYEPEEQEVVALINRCIGGGYNNRGNFWQMTVVTLGMVFCDTGKVSTKEERLEWPVTDEERNSEKGWHNQPLSHGPTSPGQPPGRGRAGSGLSGGRARCSQKQSCRTRPHPGWTANSPG